MSRHGPVADPVLDVVAQFGEGLVVAVGNENRVVTKSGGTFFLLNDMAIDNTLEQVDYAVDALKEITVKLRALSPLFPKDLKNEVYEKEI